MTYCIAVSVKEGLVLTSDSRTNAGIDNVSVYGKMHALSTHDDRRMVLLSAGNLATTQAVLDQVRRDMQDNVSPNLNTLQYLSEAADYLGRVSLNKQSRHGNAGQNGFFPAATFILAGQIAQHNPGAYLVYPEGNYITTSPLTPYLQIGETKYGKPVLDRFLTPETPLSEAARCCLISMDSTMRSNASVGAPVDLLIYDRDSLLLNRYYHFAEDDEYLITLRRSWHDKLKQSFQTLPQFDVGAGCNLPVAD